MSTPLLVLGSGGHAGVVIEIIEAVGGYEIVGMASDDEDPGRRVAGHRILSDLDGMGRFRAEGIDHVAIGIGGWTDNDTRRRVFDQAVDLGFEPVALVHPRATVSPTARIGRGGVVCAGATLVTNSSIGENTIVSTGTSIDHDSVIGNHVLISSGVTVGGRVRVGDLSLLGMGSTVVTNVAVGERCLIGAGAVVVADLTDGVTVFGIPARPVER